MCSMSLVPFARLTDLRRGLGHSFAEWVNARRGRLLWGALAAGLTLALAACGNVPPQAHLTPTVTLSSSVYMSEGALSAVDGTSRWTGNLGFGPPVSAGGVLYASVLSDDRRYEAMRAVRGRDGMVLWEYRATGSIESVKVVGDQVIVPVSMNVADLTATLEVLSLRTSDGSVAWHSAPIAAARQPQVDSPAPLISSLAVAGGRIVAMAADAQGRSYIVAWNLTDGSLAWRIPLELTGQPDSYAGPFGTATATGTTVTLVYGRVSTQSVLVVDPATGRRLWSEGGFGWADFVTPTAVVLSDGVAGTIIGLNPRDGTTLWKRDLGPGENPTHQTLSLATTSDAALFYSRYDQCQPPGPPSGQQVCRLNVYAVGIADGRLLWQRSVGRGNPEFAIKFVYGNDTLYYQRFYDDSSGTRYVLMALRSGDGATRWTHESYGLFRQALARDGTIFAMAFACKPPQPSCTVFIEALRDRDGSQVWQRIFAPYTGTLVLAGWIEVV